MCVYCHTLLAPLQALFVRLAPVCIDIDIYHTCILS